jgi:pimeloyl-ACP methyl ester carboxylesterase
MSAIVIGEGLVHYEAIGRGRPLVFIHGWLGSWRYWVPTMEDLSRRHRTYALDLWGFGDSDKRAQSYSVSGYIELLSKFLDKLGVVRPTLVGHALGGVIALLFASQSLEQVEQVVGVSVPMTSAAVSRQLSGLSGNGDALARLVARRAKFSEVEMEVHKTDSVAVTRSVNSVMTVDLRRVLPPVDVPVLLVHGRDDPLIRPPQREWLQGCGDSTRVILVDGAHHFPMLEERTKFNRLLKSFLESGDNLASLELKEEWQRRLR